MFFYHLQQNLTTEQIASNKKDVLNEIFKTEKEKIAPILYLDPADESVLDDYKKLYSDLLARWQLFVKSAQITKTLKAEKLPHQKDVELSCTFKKLCQKCKRSLIGGFCRICNKSNDHCALCNLRVTGLSWYCVSCGHGGHLKHMKTFFTGNELCPTGCGCRCAVSTSNYLNQ